MSDEVSNSGKEEILRVYINRLSDYLFVLARFCNSLYEVGDVAWPLS